MLHFMSRVVVKPKSIQNFHALTAREFLTLTVELTTWQHFLISVHKSLYNLFVDFPKYPMRLLQKYQDLKILRPTRSNSFCGKWKLMEQKTIWDVKRDRTFNTEPVWKIFKVEFLSVVIADKFQSILRLLSQNSFSIGHLRVSIYWKYIFIPSCFWIIFIIQSSWFWKQESNQTVRVSFFLLDHL